MNTEVLIKHTLIIAVFMIISIGQSQKVFSQENEINVKTWVIDDFDKAVMEGTFKVFLKQGNKNSVTVKSVYSNISDYIDIKTERGTLMVKVKRKPFDFSSIEIFVTFKTLKRLDIDGGIKLETDGYLDLEDIFIRIRGGSRMKFFTKVRDLKLVNEGGVLIELSGVAKSFDVKIAGAGHIDASEMKSDVVNFKIEGVGTGIVHATKSLNAEIIGAGKLKYRGSPNVTKSIEGLGSVQQE